MTLRQHEPLCHVAWLEPARFSCVLVGRGCPAVGGAAWAGRIPYSCTNTASAIEWLANLRGLIEHRSIARPQRFEGLELPDFTVAVKLLSVAETLPPVLQILLDREVEGGRRLHRQILLRL